MIIKKLMNLLSTTTITTTSKGGSNKYYLFIISISLFVISCNIQNCNALTTPTTDNTENANENDTSSSSSSIELIDIPWGESQQVNTKFMFHETKQVLNEMKLYMTSNFLGSKEASICKNYYSQCSMWAAAGECNANRKWMYLECAPSCQSCHNIFAEMIEEGNNNKFLQDDNNNNNNHYNNNQKDSTSSSSRTKTYQMIDISWGVQQQVLEGEYQNRTLDVISNTDIYMKEREKHTKEDEDEDEDDETSSTTICTSQHRLCSYFAALNECELNPSYMYDNCRPNCQLCNELSSSSSVMDTSTATKTETTTTTTTTTSTSTSTTATTKTIQQQEYQQEKPTIEYQQERQTQEQQHEKQQQQQKDKQQHTIDIAWGEPQYIGKQEQQQIQVKSIITKMNEYMNTVVNVQEEYVEVKDNCKCRYTDCSLWAAQGECENNSKFMQLHCAPSCQTCNYISFATRCPFDRTAPTIWNSGDLERMFQRLTTDPAIVDQYTPTILSSPSTNNGPWVVTLENVATEEECNRLIEFGGKFGYAISTAVGEQRPDGTYDSYENDFRTSTNTWCREECHGDPKLQDVFQRIEYITGIPDPNHEWLQLLKYEPGQFYLEHHDYIPFHVDREMGVRLLTVYFYLNDVEAGGGTHFPMLNLTVTPKRGRVVIWPSVLDENPNEIDNRTHHEALPVVSGIKYGANAWIHQRDYKVVYKKGCEG